VVAARDVVVGAGVGAGDVVVERVGCGTPRSSAVVDGGELAADDVGASIGPGGLGAVVVCPGRVGVVVSDRRRPDLSLVSVASDDGGDGVVVVSPGAADVDVDEEVVVTRLEIVAIVPGGGAAAGGSASTESSTGRST
jgi:hypothetical protein